MESALGGGLASAKTTKLCVGIVFAKQIPGMKRLKYLWLHDNPFGEEGATAILPTLANNWELEHLMIPRGQGTTGDICRER